jgi:hypothetical protein
MLNDTIFQLYAPTSMELPQIKKNNFNQVIQYICSNKMV